MRTFFKLIIVSGIIGGGVLIALFLIRSKPQAERKPISVGAPLVETIQVAPRNEQVAVTAMGTVLPAREVTLQPQVSGKVAEVNSRLIPGGRFQAGAMLLKIDDRDYRIAVEQQKAKISQAVVELKTEQRRQTVARKEWDLLSPDLKSISPEGRDLALREPQLESAKAALESAKSALEKARLDLERTVIEAPFNGFVREKFVDVGQFVSPGTRLVTFVGSDAFWVRISVPVEQLEAIAIPGMNGEAGAEVRVIQQNPGAGKPVVRRGRVIRLLGDLDPAGRMARLLVAVEDPLGSGSPKEPGEFPLLLDAYVAVEIQGPVLEDVFVIPRKALREDATVWTVASDERLAFTPVRVVWRTRDEVMVRGLDPGASVVTSRLPAPVEGMAVRLGDAAEEALPAQETEPAPNEGKKAA